MLWCLWLCVALPQSDSASLAGVVLQRGTRAPVPMATVSVVGGGARTQTDAAGRFVLTNLAAGTQVIHIRRVGFAPLEFEIDLAAGEAVTLRPGELMLDAAAVTVDSVVITGRGERLEPALMMQGFYERRRVHPGVFLSRAEFTTWHPMIFSDVLRRTPGVSIVANPNYHRQARAPRRGVFGGAQGNTKMGVDTRKNLIKMRGCETIAVWLDGVLLGTAEEIDVDASVGVSEIEGVEVFRGPSEIPARFTGANAACGALVLWTRGGGASR